MTLKNYSKLDELEKLETIWADGKIIGERKDEIYNVILYKLFGFYVEHYFHIEYEVLRKSLTYCDDKILDDYLPKNDIIL